MRFFKLRSLRTELLQASEAVNKIVFPPVVLGRFAYYESVVGNHLCHFRRPLDVSDSAPPKLFLNPVDEHDKSASVIAIGPMSVSHDGTKLAFLKDTVGNEAWTVVAREIDSGKKIVLPSWLNSRVAKAVEWDESGRYLFISLTEEKDLMRPSLVVVIDTQTGHEKVVAEEPDPQIMLELSATKDRRFVRSGRLSYDSSEQVGVVCSFYLFVSLFRF
jgi:protease II